MRGAAKRVAQHHHSEAPSPTVNFDFIRLTLMNRMGRIQY